MPLTLAQKSDIRRYLRYPVAGLQKVSPAGGTMADGSASWRFFQAFSFLEYKLNNLAPDEEARLTGNAFGAIAFTGPSPTPGDTVTLTFTGGGLSGSHNVVTTAASNDTLLSMALRVSQNIMLDGTMVSNGFYSIAPYGTGPYAQAAVPLPETAILNSVSFGMSVSFTGTTSPALTANGGLLGPTATVDPTTNPVTIKYGFLPIMEWLEGALVGSTQNLDTSQADVWKARSSEIKERKQLMEIWRGMLSEFLGTPINPNPTNMWGSGNSGGGSCMV